MEQLKKLAAHLSRGQKLSIAVCGLLVAAAMFAFTQWRHESGFRPLYTGLAAEDAGAVLQKLKEAGADYRLAENGATVLVPAARLAELRLQLAVAACPRAAAWASRSSTRPISG